MPPGNVTIPEVLFGH